MKDSTHVLKSGGFGVLCLVLFWGVYLIWAQLMPEAAEEDLDLAATSRFVFYLMMQYLSVVVLLFTSIFYYLWGKR